MQQPFYDWYASTNSDLREPANCLQFHVDNAGGLFFQPCLAVVARLHAPLQLSLMGFTVEFTPGLLKKCHPDHPDVLTQDAMALEAWGFALSLVRFRLRGMMYLWAMRPGMTALLVHPDADTRAHCLARLMLDYEAYQGALLQPATTFLTRALARNPFRRVVMQVVVALLLRAEWQITEELLDFTRPLWSGIGQSLIIEDPRLLTIPCWQLICIRPRFAGSPCSDKVEQDSVYNIGVFMLLVNDIIWGQCLVWALVWVGSVHLRLDILWCCPCVGPLAWTPFATAYIM